MLSKIKPYIDKPILEAIHNAILCVIMPLLVKSDSTSKAH